MIKSKEELSRACSEAGIKFSIESIWEGKVPQSLSIQLENPSNLFDAFVQYPEMYPHAKELLILWSTNGNNITGYLKDQGIFIRYYLEDGPEVFEVIASSYDQLAGHVIGHTLARRELAIGEKKNLAEFFQFEMLTEVDGYVHNSTEWEDGLVEFIKAREECTP